MRLEDLKIREEMISIKLKRMGMWGFGLEKTLNTNIISWFFGGSTRSTVEIPVEDVGEAHVTRAEIRHVIIRGQDRTRLFRCWGQAR